jgi:hypothetical protein
MRLALAVVISAWGIHASAGEAWIRASYGTGHGSEVSLAGPEVQALYGALGIEEQLHSGCTSEGGCGTRFYFKQVGGDDADAGLTAPLACFRDERATEFSCVLRGEHQREELRLTLRGEAGREISAALRRIGADPWNPAPDVRVSCAGAVCEAIASRVDQYADSRPDGVYLYDRDPTGRGGSQGIPGS